MFCRFFVRKLVDHGNQTFDSILDQAVEQYSRKPCNPGTVNIPGCRALSRYTNRSTPASHPALSAAASACQSPGSGSWAGRRRHRIF